MTIPEDSMKKYVATTIDRRMSDCLCYTPKWTTSTKERSQQYEKISSMRIIGGVNLLAGLL